MPTDVAETSKQLKLTEISKPMDIVEEITNEIELKSRLIDVFIDIENLF